MKVCETWGFWEKQCRSYISWHGVGFLGYESNGQPWPPFLSFPWGVISPRGRHKALFLLLSQSFLSVGGSQCTNLIAVLWDHEGVGGWVEPFEWVSVVFFWNAADVFVKDPAMVILGRCLALNLIIEPWGGGHKVTRSLSFTSHCLAKAHLQCKIISSFQDLTSAQALVVLLGFCICAHRECQEERRARVLTVHSMLFWEHPQNIEFGY